MAEIEPQVANIALKYLDRVKDISGIAENQEYSAVCNTLMKIVADSKNPAPPKPPVKKTRARTPQKAK